MQLLQRLVDYNKHIKLFVKLECLYNRRRRDIRMLIDTHCHLEFILSHEKIEKLSFYDIDLINTIVRSAHEKSVTKIITIGTDYQRSLLCTEIAQAIPSVYCTVGIHPCDAHEDWATDFEKIKKLVVNKEKNKIVGIGESGLDFYHPNFNVDRQKDVFTAHIELALQYDLALVVHTRSAIDETLALLNPYTKNNLKAVIHCFDQDWPLAQEIIKMNFLMGIGGIVTYPKNENLRTVVLNDQLNNIILETDAPFLPPQVIRGKQNEPAQVHTVAQYLANFLHWPYEMVAEKTTHNALKLFGSLL